MPDSYRPVSPAHGAGRSQSYYFQLALYAGGNVLAVGICLLLWFCWDVLSAFQEPLVWSYLCSLSLRDIKRYLVNTARRELQTSSFVVCCGKLVFLPAVIVWQLFEELRDKLQSKYQELQQHKKQGTPTKAGAAEPLTQAAAQPAQGGKGAADLNSNIPSSLFGSSDDTSDSEQELQQSRTVDEACAAAAEASASAATAINANSNVLHQRRHQHLRQRKAAAANKAAAPQQSKHHQGHQRPPLGPRPLAGKPSSGRAWSQPAAGAVSASQGKAAAMAAAKAAPSRQSKLQRRLRRYKHIAVRQLKWYGICLVELLKFILGSLVPRQQPQHQQVQPVPPQQQYERQMSRTPSSSARTYKLSHAASHPVASPASSCVAGAPAAPGVYVNDLGAVATTPMRVSAAGSISSSCCTSELGQQNIWMSPQQQHQAWQQRQQQQQRLSTSYSSPSLPALEMHNAMLRQKQLPLHSTAAAAAAAVDSIDGQQRHQHVTMDDSVLTATSFGGWAGALPRSPVISAAPSLQPLQQQQQQRGLSRSGSNFTSGGTYAHLPDSSTGAGAGVATGMLSRPASPLLSQTLADGVSSPSNTAAGGSVDHGVEIASPVTPWMGCVPDATSTPMQNRTYSAAPSMAYGSHMEEPAPAGLSFAGSLSYGLSSAPMPWEGLGLSGIAGLSGVPTNAPGSVMTSIGGSSSPSNMLFKWLLRGIVLYEGWRYAQTFWDPDQPLFVLLLLLGGTLAVAGGLPLLLLPSSLWRPPTQDVTDKDEQSMEDAGDAAAGGQTLFPGQATTQGSSCEKMARKQHASPQTQVLRSPFEEQQQKQKQADAAAKSCSSSSHGVQHRALSLLRAGWSMLVQLLIRADMALRAFCSSSFLDTAVSGLIVVGLILGSVVLSVVLLVQVGEESRQAVVHMNALVRQKVDTEGALRQGVRSLLQEYEGQVTTMLRDSLPSVTQYVESRAVEFLISHNLSRVLLDLEMVKSALHMPGDCSQEARVQSAVQLANSSIAVQEMGQQRLLLQQQLDAEQQLISMLAEQYEALQIQSSSFGSAAGQGGTSRQYNNPASSPTGCSTDDTAAAGSGGTSSDSSKDVNNDQIAHQLLQSQMRLADLQGRLQAVVTVHEAATEQLQLAKLRLQNCQSAATAAQAEAAGHGRGLSSFVSSIWVFGSHAGSGGPTNRSAEATHGAQLNHVSHSVSHLRKLLTALTRFDFGAASNEATAALGHLLRHPDQEQQQQQQQSSCSSDGKEAADDTAEPSALLLVASACDVQQRELQHVGYNSTSISACSRNGSSNTGMQTASSSGSAASVSATAPSATGNIMRVAQGAAYPLITSLRTLSSVFLAGIGSTTAVALGTGLGVLRLGLGVVKFLVQLGVFASVLYTLLALDIDPVEQLLRLLPMSEASQDRASRAVTKAMRGVFVSSLKLAAFHAGFTWLTLRAFNTHFVCLSTAASAVVAVLPLVPVALVALPAVLELALLRGAPVQGVILGALHLGAYYFGDDLIFREVEPTLPYLVGLGVFGGMYTFKNPLQGVLLGPMVLALLSVGYNLHRDLY